MALAPGPLAQSQKLFAMDNIHTSAGNIFQFQPSSFKTVGEVHRERNKMAIWTTFLALALGPLDQFHDFGALKLEKAAIKLDRKDIFVKFVKIYKKFKKMSNFKFNPIRPNVW